MKQKVGIIGDGKVGSALSRGLERAGYQVRTVGKNPGQVKETGGWADVVILAVPYGAIDEAISELGDGINGKTLVDVTNALTGDMQLASGCTTSGAETLQRKARGAKVVKAFNTQFASHMDVNAVVYCGNDDSIQKELQTKGAANVKRIIVHKNINWFSEQGQSPYFILDTEEIKTTWHPIENIGGGGGGY